VERSARPCCRASPSRSFPIKRAIGAGALFNLVISVPATLFFLTADLGAPGRTVDALGDVALFCVAALSLPALFVAPVAARWSVRAPVSVLRDCSRFASLRSPCACCCGTELALG
jgi:hypothetical protein